MVTGATDGIGKQYALQLAAKGFNIGLVARNPEKLEKVAKEIEEAYKVETKQVVFDFDTHYTEEVVKEYQEKLQVFDQVSVLVNNAGVGSFEPADVLDVSKATTTINVNIFS